jgi:SAM-dependent methyltransferase
VSDDVGSDGPTGADAGFDAGTYGHSFADVYDDWYPPDEDAAAAVGAVATLAGPAGSVLELGVGTGRLALPLAPRVGAVTGLDSSTAMIERLRAKDPGGSVAVVLGDVAAPTGWPEERFDVIVAANNLLLNLPDGAAQRRCVELAAAHLRPGGHLIVECVLPAPLEGRVRRLEVREVTAGRVVLIATDADPGTGLVTGQHVELLDGERVRLRPWRVRPVGVDEVDRWAAGAGLELVSRRADWSGAAYDADGTRHVSTYRSPATPGTDRA